MQKLISILFFFMMYISNIMSQELFEFYEIDSINNSFKFGVKNKKGEIIIPASANKIEIDEFGTIYLDYKKIFDKEGKEKLSQIKDQFYKKNNLYYKSEYRRIGFYNPENNNECIVNYTSGSFFNYAKESIDYDKPGFCILEERGRSYLLNHKLEKIAGMEFKEGCILDNNYVLTLYGDGKIKIFDSNLNIIYTGTQNEVYKYEDNYIFIFNDKNIRPIKVYSMNTRSLKEYDKKIFNRPEYLGVELDNEFIVLKNDSIILRTEKINVNESDIELGYNNPNLVKYGKNLYRNNALIVSNVDNIRSITDSIYLVRTYNETFLYYGEKEIDRRNGQFRIETFGNIIIFYSGDHLNHQRYRNVKIFNLDGSRISNDVYSTLEFIEEDSLFIISNGDKYGIMDIDGKMVLDLKYSHLFKNTKAICPTPFTYFGKFNDEKTYHVLNLRNEIPEIKNITTSYEKVENKVSYDKVSNGGIGISFSASGQHIDLKEINYDFYKNKGFVDLYGQFHSLMEKNYSFINSEKGTIYLQLISEQYSKPKLYKMSNYFSEYIALNKEISNNQLIKIYKIKITDPNQDFNFDVKRDTAGIINTRGEWVIGPDLNFNYQIITSNLISKDNMLYSLDSNQLSPLFAFYSLKFPFVKLNKNDNFLMLDIHGKIVRDNVIEFDKISSFPDYHFIKKQDGETEVVDKNGNLIYVLGDYQLYDNVNKFGYTSFISNKDSTFLLFDTDFKKTIRCKKLVGDYNRFAYWDERQGYLYFDDKSPPMNLPLEIGHLVKKKHSQIGFENLEHEYFILDFQDCMVVLNKTNSKYQFVMNGIDFRKVFGSSSTFILFEAYDLKSKKILTYEFNYKERKLKLIR